MKKLFMVLLLGMLLANTSVTQAKSRVFFGPGHGGTERGHWVPISSGDWDEYQCDGEGNVCYRWDWLTIWDNIMFPSGPSVYPYSEFIDLNNNYPTLDAYGHYQ